MNSEQTPPPSPSEPPSDLPPAWGLAFVWVPVVSALLVGLTRSSAVFSLVAFCGPVTCGLAAYLCLRASPRPRWGLALANGLVAALGGIFLWLLGTTLRQFGKL